MQDRYAGDIGDFGKFALLRALGAGADLRLAVVWCLYPDEYHNGDGRHVAYLDRGDFRDLDADLHGQLRAIVASGRRSVSAVAATEILPRATVFFTEPTISALRSRAVEREAYRAGWLERALEATAGCAAVFFDPDNGLEAQSVPLRATKAGKYVFWHELNAFWQRGQSLVVYHHTNRTASVEAQVRRLRAEFAGRYPSNASLHCLVFRRGSCRLFWIVAQPEHAAAVGGAVDGLLASDIGQLFEAG